MKNQVPKLEWFEYKWRWVFLAMAVATVVSILVESSLGTFLPQVIARSAGLASMIAAFVAVASFNGEAARMRPAMKQGAFFFCTWTPFLILVDWAVSGVRAFSSGGSPS